MNSTSENLLEVKDLKKYFPVHGGVFSQVKGYVYAVDGVSFNVKKGETLGLVGESGCGKTTTGRAILRLEPATGGKVYFEGQDVYALSSREMRILRREMQIIFQDPYASLNPRMKVGELLEEPFQIHREETKAVRREKIRSFWR